MKSRLRLLVVFLCVLLAATSRPVSAHAELVSSDPQSNAGLARSPAQVALEFSEAVEPRLSFIHVLDANGQAVDLGDVQVDADNPRRMTVSLHSLADGVYTVSWKAISAADGHLTTGSFPFAVGNVDPAALAAKAEKKSTRISASAIFSKWLLLVSLALLVSRATFTGLVWQPAVMKSGVLLPRAAAAPAAWELLSRAGLAGVLLGLGLSLLSGAGQATGSELALPWSPEAGRMLLETRLGLVWLAQMILALASAWLLLGKPGPWKTWGLQTVGFILLATVSFSSHAAAEPQPTLPILADWLHLAVVCLWVGGLAYFVTGLRTLQPLKGKQRTALVSQLIVHFSVMAIACVSLLGISGLYTAVLQVGALPALSGTLYGRSLLLKLGVAAPLLLLGAVNLLVISPRLRRDRLKGAERLPVVKRFSQVVLWELGLACAVLLCASLLTSLPPANLPGAASGLNGAQQADDLHAELFITPGRVGQNTFSVKLSSNGQPVQAVKTALLRFTPYRAGLAPSEAQLVAQGNGLYTAKGAYLSLPDDWQVQVVVRREGKFDAFAIFNFNVRNSVAAERPFATTQVAGGLLLLLALAFWAVIFLLAGKGALKTIAGGLLAGILLGLGILFSTRPLPVSAQVNPIPANAQSVSVGKALFTANCAACHGESGKGDGPVGLTMVPRPADLTQHAIPGVHTDAQLFDWITNGFPGTRMPPFKTALNDTQRWNLVNFIRTLAPQ